MGRCANVCELAFNSHFLPAAGRPAQRWLAANLRSPMSFIRKYWIAGLVILLVAMHAIIIGYVRSEATRLKTVASSEIPLGLFYKQSSDRNWLTQMRIHVQVPAERRLAARATIEHNRWSVHEAVEEAIRRLDESLLLDPSLVAIKEQIKLAIDETLHEGIVERVVINDRVDLEVREFHYRPGYDLIAPGEENQMPSSSTLTSVRPVRPTLAEQTPVAADDGDEGEHAAHGDEHGGPEHEGAESAAHAAHGSSHGAAHGAAKSSGHGAAKPAAHGAAKSAGHGAAKSSGHGAAKPAAHGDKKSAGHAKKAKSGH